MSASRDARQLVFDEAGTLLGSWNEVEDGYDRLANLEVDYLPQRLEA